MLGLALSAPLLSGALPSPVDELGGKRVFRHAAALRWFLPFGVTDELLQVRAKPHGCVCTVLWVAIPFYILWGSGGGDAQRFVLPWMVSLVPVCTDIGDFSARGSTAPRIRCSSILTGGWKVQGRP